MASQHQNQQSESPLQHQHQHHQQQQGRTPRSASHNRGSSSSHPSHPSSSSSPSAIHHSHNESPASATLPSVLNFGVDTPASIVARTPASRGRGKTSPSSHQHLHAYHRPSSSPASQEFISASVTPSMDPAVRTEKAQKHQSLNQSFPSSSSTPQSAPAKVAGRKRARTLDYPPESEPTDDDAKVKGGHSLRKRARIDYAQMNEDDTGEVHVQPADGTALEPSMSGPRPARKRLPITTESTPLEPQQEEATAQQPVTAPAKKRGRNDIQRTASPVPQRRPYTKRKPTLPPAAIENHSPERQPSDTELKDTIEVGGAMDFPSSSQSTSHPSETASNKSDQSPLSHRSSTRKLLPQAQGPSPAIATQSDKKPSEDPSSPKLLVQLVSAGADQQVLVQSPTSLDGPNFPLGENTGTPQQLSGPSYNQEDTSQVDKNTPSIAPAVPADSNHQHHHQPDLHSSDLLDSQDLQTSLISTDAADLPESMTLSSSQTSIDSDATELNAPGDFPLKQPATLPVKSEPTSSQAGKVAMRRKSKAQADIQQPDALEGSQESQKPSLRPRRRMNQVSEEAVAADQESSLQTKDEVQPEQTTANKKPDGKFKAATRSNSVSELPVPTSPDTARKRGPGRPPKIRQSIEHEPPKPKERRASRTATRLEQPRPMRSFPPRDFSFLTPYLETNEIYPENTQDPSASTPLDTPFLQLSESRDEQGESLGCQEQQPLLDVETASNAPTPAPIYEALTPAPESAAPSRANSAEPVIESMRKPKRRKQYSFPRIRSPTEYTNALEGYKDMSDQDLYNVLEQANKALVAWQDEWQDQRLITEDEDNANRRRAHDAALAAREARDMAKTNGSVTMEKRDFEVKGLRIDRLNARKHERPQSNPEAYARYQDQIAAQAWGFEWDPRPSMISRQDPIAQRDGLQNTRLRNRPKPSQRAAEAIGEEPAGIVPSKRTRRPARLLSDDSKELSRAPTPVEATVPRKRRRKRNADGEFESDNELGTQPPEAQPEPAPVQEPPPKKKRGPKPKAVKEAEARAAAEREAAAERDAAIEREAAVQKPVQQAAEAAIPNSSQAASAVMDQPANRKRRRGAAAPPEPELAQQDVPTASIEDVPSRDPVSNAAAASQVEVPTIKKRRGRKPKAEIPPAVFYGTTTAATTAENGNANQGAEEKRPSTSSSTSSVHTVESSYSFRNRARKNYSELADPINQVHAEARPKRGRKPKNRQEDPEPTSYPSNLAPAPYTDGHYGQQLHGYTPLAASVLAAPNNPFINVTGGGPGSAGPLLAPSPARQGQVAGPHPVGANPFSAPSNLPVEAPSSRPQSPVRRKIVKIKINTNKAKQFATPQPSGPPLPPQSVPLAPLQPPSNFHGYTSYEPNMYGQPAPSYPGSGPGQVMFPVNAPPGSMTMPPMLQNPPPLLPLGAMTGRHGSLPPDGRATSGSGRGTPVPSSNASANGGVGPDGDELSEKDYASMTKSEKMSASMKARWANGSMRQAVNKRKETLARKKQKVSDDKTTTPTPQPESAPPSAHSQAGTTPPTLPPSATLPDPAVTSMMSQMASQSHQQHAPPPHGYDGMLHAYGSNGAPHPSSGGVVLPAPQGMGRHEGVMPPYREADYRAGVVPPPPHAHTHAHMHAHRESMGQNPFLDTTFADLHPRLPFANGDMNGRYEQSHGHGWRHGQ